MNTLLIFCLLIFSCFAFSAPGSVSGEISEITVKETGYILIRLAASHSNPEACEQTTVVAVAANHIAKKEIMSVALSALTLRKMTRFWISGCYEAYGTSYPIAVIASISR